MRRRVFVATPLLLSATLSSDCWDRLWRPSVDASEQSDSQLVRVAGTAFGTSVTLTALAGEQAAPVREVRAALHAAMQEVQQVDALLSLFRPDSQLSILNRNGRLDEAHPHLLRNLEFARTLSDLTAGAFDITVQPLWELFAQAKRSGGLPEASAIASARELVDFRAVRIEGSRVLLDRPDTKLTLNSLAQGYAVDVVLQILQRAGVGAALIDTGEIGNLGLRAPARPWTVGVQHPREPQSLLAAIAMDGRVLSTSGDYATHFTPDFRYHHIFDPATGVSPPVLSSTIALAASGLVADGISTAMMVMDRKAGAALLGNFPGADALWIDKQLRLDATAGVPFAT